MDRKIEQFLAQNHLLSLSVLYNGAPYGANCFYVYSDCALIFASSLHSNHIQGALQNPKVAGTIACCEQDIAKLQGVQFIGELRQATKEERRIYYQKYPLAKTIGEPIWAIELEWIKMTDNTLGFKKKKEWRR